MTGISIVGVGETVPVRQDERPFVAMVMEAVNRALADAGLSAADVDGYVTESADMPQRAPAEAIMAGLGQPPAENPFISYGHKFGCGLVAAPKVAEMAINSGRASVVVCWYGLQYSGSVDGPRSVYAADPIKADLEMPQGWYGQAAYFGGIAQRYGHEYGLTDSQLAATALEARENAMRTPHSMRTSPLTLEDYRSSPVIASPLRKADCCLVNEGAIAFVMTSTERARDLAQPAVNVVGVGVGTTSVKGDAWFTQNPDYLTTPAAISGRQAFAEAGMTPSDVNFVEFYDCFTMFNILQFEDLGFVDKGEGAAFAEEKGRSLTDRLPTNTHGGLLSHSFMLGGGHVIEAVRQLRHQRGDGQVPNANVGLVTALGVPHHATLLLQRDS